MAGARATIVQSGASWTCEHVAGGIACPEGSTVTLDPYTANQQAVAHAIGHGHQTTVEESALVRYEAK